MEVQRIKPVNKIRIAVLVFLGVLVIAVAVIFGLFHIREADVVGNEFYSAEEIKKMVMSDSLAENSLYLTWKYSQEDAAEALPFLNAVEISMITPYHVQIKVYEKTIAGYLMYSGSRVYFDTDGTVVEISGEEREGIAPFSGIAMGQPVVGEKIPLEDEAFLSDIVEASYLIHQSGLEPDEVHFDENQELILYFGQVRVLLGNSSSMEDKISNLQALYPEMEGMSGTLHMENYTPGTTTLSFKIDERGEEESELIINLNNPDAEETTEEGGDGASDESGEDGTAGDGAADGTGENGTAEDGTADAAGDAGADGSDSSDTGTASGYVEDPSRITTNADGSQTYTDPAGNVTSNLDQQYLGDDGQVITDGYGYIDPYTGAYILN